MRALFAKPPWLSIVCALSLALLATTLHLAWSDRDSRQADFHRVESSTIEAALPAAEPRVDIAVEGLQRPTHDLAATGRGIYSMAKVPVQHATVDRVDTASQVLTEIDLQRYYGERYAAYDRAIRNGPSDPNWMPRQDLIVRIEDADPNSKVIDIQCGADLCRVEVWHQDGSDKKHFLRKIASQLPPPPGTYPEIPPNEANVFAGGVMFNDYNNNPAVTDMYVSRPGRDFGDPPLPSALPPPSVMQAIQAYRAQSAAGR